MYFQLFSTESEHVEALLELALSCWQVEMENLALGIFFPQSDAVKVKDT